MNKLLIICGPTATGKTSLALHVAEKFKGEIISADSRQVYKYFDHVTGKDIPRGFKYEDGRYTNGKLSIWGYDIVTPDEEFSAKLYSDYASKIIRDIQSRGKLPILEGGTGFYINAVMHNLDQISVPRDQKIRDKYKNSNADKMCRDLMKLDPKRAIAMNDSDMKNPRRLMRQLEIAWHGNLARNSKAKDHKNYDTLWIGLNYKARGAMYRQIEKRVKDRLGYKLEKEVRNLKQKGYFKKAQETTPGYKYWDDPERWMSREKQYAKRQLTWFKRIKEISWFEADDDNLTKNVDDKIQKWYS